MSIPAARPYPLRPAPPTYRISNRQYEELEPNVTARKQTIATRSERQFMQGLCFCAFTSAADTIGWTLQVRMCPSHGQRLSFFGIERRKPRAEYRARRRGARHA
jgi:hypothetical protein